MVIECDLLVHIVFGIVLFVNEISISICHFSSIHVVPGPHLDSEVFLHCKAFINDSYSHNKFGMRESCCEEILNETLPDLIQEFKCWLLNVVQEQSHFILSPLGVLWVFPLWFNTFPKHAQSADPLYISLDIISIERNDFAE